MSTEPVPVQTELEQLQKEIQQEQAAAPDAAAVPEEYRVEIAGQVFKGKDEKEVLDKLVKAQENATNLIRDQREQLRVAAERSKPIATGDTNGTDNNKYDPQKYLQHWEKGEFLEAQKYLMRFDPEVQEVVGVVDRVKQNAIVDRFNQMRPDYERSEENSRLMTEYFETHSGMNYQDPIHLAHAWDQLKSSGTAKVTEQPDDSPRRPTPPPSPRARASASAEPAIHIGMTTEQMEESLRKQGVNI